MKKYAWIKDGKVLTVTEAADDFVVPAHWVETTENVATGDLYDGTTFSKPPVDVDGIRNRLRGEAMRKLRLCDWTQLPDGTTGPVKADWLQYRASLRQLLQNPTLPVDTVVPEPPYPFDET
jgi:hypothetical protein